MKFILEFYKSAVYLAIENQNHDIVKLLLENNNIDVNDTCIFLKNILYSL